MTTTNETRKAALDLLTEAGIRWSMIDGDQRPLIDFMREGKSGRALIKAGSIGNAMVKASEDDPDRARLSGFGDDVTDVLFAIGAGAKKTVEAFLVPRREAEMAWRENHRAWKNRHPNSPPNTTWVIRFSGAETSSYTGFAQKWAAYRISPHNPSPPPAVQPLPGGSRPSRGISPDEAKKELAIFFGVKPENIKIIVET